MGHQKLLLIGLDGACFDFIDPLVRKGKLPTFKKLIANGVRAKLRSTIPPTTIPAWVSMFTGLSEGSLGCFGQQRWEEQSHQLEPVSILSWKGKLIWDLVSERKKVGVFRVQTLSRSYPINGFMITDIYSWDRSSCGNVYPPDLSAKLKDFWINEETEGQLLPLTQMKLALRNDPKRIEVASYLLDHNKPDLFVFITRIPDVMTHFTTNLRKIRLAYEVIDINIGKLIDKAKMKNYSVIIVSDHGTGRQVNRRFYANNWLETYGFLKKVPKGTSKLDRFFSTTVDNLTEFLRSKGLSPLLRSLFGYIEEKIARGASSSTFDVSEELIQWENTKAFSYEGGGTNFTGIKILLSNLSSQTTDSDEYEDLRRNLCQKLKKYQDPKTGVNVVEDIFLREQIFQGSNVHLMPDIVLKLNENYVTANLTSFSTSSILSSEKELIHTENGVFIASGPIFEKNLRVEDANVVDVAPTILHILNTPIPKDMDGKVLKSIFNKESGLLDKDIEYCEPKSIEEGYQITQREKEEIKEKLRALGYL